jgi:hypothetical protein
MTDREHLDSFLSQARRRALVESSVRASGFALSLLAAALLVLGLAAAFLGPAASWPYVGIGTIVACIAGGIVLGYVTPARVLDAPTAVAHLVGERCPVLASDLLSAVELRAVPADEANISPDLTEAFLGKVAQATRPLVVENLLPLDRAIRMVFAAMGAFLVLLIAVLASPSTMGRGMRTLFHAPTLFEGAQVASGPLVGDVRVTYDYPAYTGLPRQTIEGSTGDVRALRGTHVRIDMKPLRTARQARLLLGEDGEGGVSPADLDHGQLSASFALDESKSYRVWLLPFLGRPIREDRAHRIVVESDQPPEVDIVGPADRLELATPKPVEVAYHARDDFGLGEVALVYRINEGPEQRSVLKNAQGLREMRGTTMFEPASAMLVPGARVAYHIEAKDRDEVSGSKTGASRTLYLVIQNPREDHEDRLAREHEILEKVIATLADRLEFDETNKTGEPAQRLTRLREVHDGEQTSLAQLRRLIDQLRHAGGVAKVLAGQVAAVAGRLGKLMHDEDELLAALSGKGDRASAWSRLAATSARHNADQESLVLVLDDVIGRQRLDDLDSMGKDLVSAHKRLQELLDRYKATGDEQLRRQIEREVRELRERIAEMARKIAEVKARNEVSPEWMNLPDTHKAAELAERLDSLLAKGDARSLDEALAELGNSLNSLREALDKNAAGFGETRFPQESRALAELERKIGDLEGDQRMVADEGRSLAKEVDGELARRLESQQAEFMAKAKQKLEQIQRKMARPLPRELGSSAEAANEGVREDIRQIRRLLPAKEWNEAQREAERMVSGLDHLQALAGRQAMHGQEPSPNALDVAERVGEASDLARELAADLAHVVPRGSEVMSAEQRAKTQNLGQRQASVEDRTRDLSRELGKSSESVPGAERAASELQEIADQMRQAGQDLSQGSAHEGAGRATEAAGRLAKLRENMQERPSDGSRGGREPVHIPDADAYKAPREWRQELMEAMREKAPEKFRDEVRRYYEELVK